MKAPLLSLDIASHRVPEPLDKTSHTEVVKFKWLLAVVACVALQAEDITPRIGYIEVYGAHKTSEKKIRSALGVEPGGLLPISRADMEARIDKIPGVIDSRVEGVCCDGRQTVLYVGVEEKNTPRIEFHPVPGGDVKLPQDMLDTYHSFLDRVSASVARGKQDEDLTNGYSLMVDPDSRQLQQELISMTARDLPLLDAVIRGSRDSEQRSAAAYILQYAPRGPHTTQTFLNALQYALQDPDSDVRKNAMRSLKAVAVGGRLHPEQHIRLEPTWFVELMNSLVWSDRRNASLALVDLTEMHNTESLNLLRDRALASVVDMARWRDLRHALPGFILAGRLAGLTNGKIEEAWVSGDHEPVIEGALKSTRNHRKSATLTSNLN